MLLVERSVGSQSAAPAAGELLWEREGKGAEQQDVVELERGEAGEVLVVDLAAAAAEVVDGVVHVLGVPEHEDVEREAERGELVFLALAVGLPQFAAVAVEDDARDSVAAFVAVEMNTDAAPVGVVST
ncbi:MAG: hypothetical protein QOD83_2165 [Solirubrobacteraceae bacterium]|jgi:hypothetical protein|nr:hypothetical protein [Solirubrobacteraceae bacterium]